LNFAIRKSFSRKTNLILNSILSFFSKFCYRVVLEPDYMWRVLHEPTRLITYNHHLSIIFLF